MSIDPDYICTPLEDPIEEVQRLRALLVAILNMPDFRVLTLYEKHPTFFGSPWSEIIGQPIEKAQEGGQ